MKVKAYKLFKEHDLVHDYKEYIELVRLRCMWINDTRIEDPSKTIDIPDKIEHITAGIKNIKIKRGSNK